MPLLITPRLDPVRLFITDDVGVGKTIEALLVARELLDRGEIRRFFVLCPPYLCVQWAKELNEKLNLEPIVIRSGTVGHLERQLPAGKSLCEHFPVQVGSIDSLNTERNGHQFLQFCPELVVVDEVHGAAAAQARSQQERHELLREVAKNQRRHLILLTANPHSGIEDAFRSLLALLRPNFAAWNVAELSEEQRIALARHFVLRTRADILSTWETVALFPTRSPSTRPMTSRPATVSCSSARTSFAPRSCAPAKALTSANGAFAIGGALALLRCVMSSPAPAVAALVTRASSQWQEASGEEETLGFSPYVFEPADERTDDETPTPPVEATEATLDNNDRRQLRELARLAEQPRGPAED